MLLSISQISICDCSLVIVNASERYWVAGIGDAMATWYEARVCEDNPVGSNLVGCRPTLAASAISEKCAQTLFEYGVSAAENIESNQNSDSVERVVEANTLLSGIALRVVDLLLLILWRILTQR